MAAYRQVFVSFWQDAFVLDLTPEEKYFYVYLMTNGKTSQCGVYELPIRVIEMDTGYNRETVEKLIERFISYGKILYCKTTKEIMILNWLKYNLVNSPKVKSCMRKELLEVKNKDFVKKLAEVVKEQKLVEDVNWIPCLQGEESIDTVSIPQEKTKDTVSIPPVNPIDTLSLDYGEEREREVEEEIEKEVEVEKEREEEKNLMCHSLSLIKYFENLTGQIGALNLYAIKLAVSMHGHYNVKSAVDKAIETNKPNMQYINGILKNWAAQGYPWGTKENTLDTKGNTLDTKGSTLDTYGYPRERGGIKNGSVNNLKRNSEGKYSGFKPQEPRALTEEQRRELEAELL